MVALSRSTAIAVVDGNDDLTLEAPLSKIAERLRRLIKGITPVYRRPDFSSLKEFYQAVRILVGFIPDHVHFKLSVQFPPPTVTYLPFGFNARI